MGAVYSRGKLISAVWSPAEASRDSDEKSSDFPLRWTEGLSSLEQVLWQSGRGSSLSRLPCPDALILQTIYSENSETRTRPDRLPWSRSHGFAGGLGVGGWGVAAGSRKHMVIFEKRPETSGRMENT